MSGPRTKCRNKKITPSVKTALICIAIKTVLTPPSQREAFLPKFDFKIRASLTEGGGEKFAVGEF